MKLVDNLVTPQAPAIPKKKAAPSQSRSAPVPKKSISSEREALKRVDVGLMSPTEYGSSLSMSDAINFIEAILAQYAQCTGIFVNDDQGVPATTPSSFVQYCLGLLVTWISRNGQLGGSNKNDVCSDPDDLCVPIPLAKYLEHLAPCIEDGARLIVSYSLDYSISTSRTSYPDTALYPAALRTAVFPKYQYYSVYLNPNYGEYQGFDSADAGTLPALWSSRARQISQELESSPLATICFKDIPRLAPNASAHTIWITPYNVSSGNLIADANVQACNIFREYNVEEAMLFASFRSGNTPLNPLTKSVPRLSEAPELSLNNTTQLPAMNSYLTAAYCAAFVGCRQKKYPTGSFLGHSGGGFELQGQKLKTLNIAYQPVNTASFSQSINMITKNAMQQTNTAWTTVEKETYRVLTYAVIYTLLQLKLNYNSPIPHYTNTNVASSLYSPQSYYVDSDWAATAIPPVAQKMVDTLGFVMIQGGLVVPYTKPFDDGQRGVTPITNTQSLPTSIWKFMFFAQVDGGFRHLAQGYASLPATTTTPVVRVNGQNLSYNFIAGLYGAPDATGEGTRRGNNFVNGNKADIIAAWKWLLQDHTDGASFNESYIQPKDLPAGRCSAMLVQCVAGRNSARHEIFPPDPNVASDTSNYTFNCYEAILVGGLVALPKACLVDAVTEMCCFNVLSDTRVNQGKYAFQVPSGTATSAMLTTLSQRTFAPDSSFAQAAQSARAKAANRPKVTLGSAKLPATAHESDWSSPVWERIASTAADSLQMAGRTAAGALCAGGGPVASMACAGAVDLAANALRTWIGIGSQDPEHPGEGFLRKIDPKKMKE